MPELPYIPEYITVHLGPPDSPAQNVTVPFNEYIKNVASSEIYPTWPESAIRANIYAQISFALNRIYTEYYRSRGYDFDITNSTAYDQSFVNGRDIFENISRIVDEIFTDYISRQGTVEPLFAQYCDGTNVICDGLSQWGTVELANQGLTPYEILTYYYGNDININRDTPIRPIEGSAPLRPLRPGDAGEDVRTVQLRLNRISQNYPSIPKIYPVDGVYTYEMLNAVQEFQRIFDLTPDGIIGNATWYKILQIYNAVKRLNELDSEGLELSEVEKVFPEELSRGDTGVYVKVAQYYLAVIAQNLDTVPEIDIDGIFGPRTEAAVKAFQRDYGLPETGIIDERTWNDMYNVYRGIVESTPEYYTGVPVAPYPGFVLSIGMRGNEVRLLQEYLSKLSEVYPEIPQIAVDGVFGPATRSAVMAAQQLFGLPVTGIVFALTWDAITSAYQDVISGETAAEGQYAGYTLG
ncbi:MAG TPA: peptidoglycan-binding protein [Firmicutes bacterium]|nr:peptidoglycan-binding protein [Bacillota bacterium]